MGSHAQRLQRLVATVKELSYARSMADIAASVRRAARELTGADGATFVLRDVDRCYYFDEDAIAPLWKGRRFPMEACISGWAMTHRAAVAITDIYADSRIPHEAYRPTFVKSLVMVPVRIEDPVAAIGNYWASHHTPTPEEIELLQALADSTSVAMENVRMVEGLEQRIRERTAELEAANRELDAFSYSVSHDLLNPVGAIAGFASLLRRELGTEAPPKVLRYVTHIDRASRHMQELIDNLLALSRASRAEPARTTVDVTALALDVGAGLREQQQERSVDFRVQQGLAAFADAGLLRVVLENLIGNAFKYTSRQERATIEVAETEHLGSRTFLVRDDGAGFDPSLAAKLFKPFERLHSDAEFPGTGVGLATCERIIRRHGGRIWAESAPDHGATFYFALHGAS